MKKIIFLCLLCELLIHSVQAQYVQSPTSYAYKAVEGRNALQGPVGCGEPADSVRSFYAPDSTRTAYYLDTCDNVWYYFNPKSDDQEWHTITGGGAGGGIGAVYAGNCLTQINDSTLALNLSCVMDTAFALNDSTIRYVKGDGTFWDVRNGSSLITYEGDTVTINNIKIKNKLSIPLTDTTNAIKSCGALIYDTINERFYGDRCLNGVHDQWACLDCAGGSTIDTTGHWVYDVYKRADSFFYAKNGTEVFIGIDSVGTSGSTITLQTNGVNNGSQDTLNLQEGTNIDIVDNGTGTVTISYASGLVTIDTTITTDGTVLLLTIPHSLGVTPSDVHVQVDNEAGLSTFVPPYFDDTNIYIPYSIGPICTCEYLIRITP